MLSPSSKILLILLALPLLALNVWVIGAIARYFHSLVVILVGASLLAFLLNYPVSFMEHHGAKRGRATIIVFLLAITLLGSLAITLFPLALAQARGFIYHLPQWMSSGKHQLNLLNNQFRDTGLPFSTDILSGQINDRLQGQLKGLTGEAVSVAVITLTSLLDLLLTLVLAFYLLLHGKDIWNSLMGWLPPPLHQPFSDVLRLSFQKFFLGQLIMASCLGSALTLVFLILQVPFGLLFGLSIGVMALVPFGGTIGIILVTLLVALRDISLGLTVLLASILVQQIVENLVGPKVLGKVTGLNPVWVLIAILSGARLGGLLGVVVAVPISVVIKTGLQSIRSDT